MFKRTRLDNGMTVVMERTRNVRSVSLGVWVRVGSRNESPEKGGISHFLEHMFFKGTRKRSAHQIAVEIDSLGGELNAFTSKEGTTFYIKVLDEHLAKGVELLSDVFLHSTFPQEEIGREKNVVREELKMVEDTPDEYIHDLFSLAVWGDNGLARPVLGRRQTVRSFTRQDLLRHIRTYYGTADTIVACAGNFEEKKLLDLLNRSLGGLRRASEPPQEEPPEFHPGVRVHGRELAEVHICLGVRGIRQASEDRYAALLLNTVLGGGISSRLFQEIREKRGLAYSVYSFLSSYADAGVWAVYAGTGRRKVNEVVERAAEEFRRLPETMTEAELQRAKDQLKGSLILGLESTGRRMQNIANQEIYFGRYYSPSEIISAIDAVGLSETRALAERLVSDSGMALTVLGPMRKRDVSVTLPGGL
jgi:predicted Zn-dependent peptidase